MDLSDKDIDKLFKDGLGDLNIPYDNKGWSKMSRMLFWRKVLSYIYIGLPILFIALVGGYFLLCSGANNTNDTSSTNSTNNNQLTTGVNNVESKENTDKTSKAIYESNIKSNNDLSSSTLNNNSDEKGVNNSNSSDLGEKINKPTSNTRNPKEPKANASVVAESNIGSRSSQSGGDVNISMNDNRIEVERLAKEIEEWEKKKKEYKAMDILESEAVNEKYTATGLKLKDDVKHQLLIPSTKKFKRVKNYIELEFNTHITTSRAFSNKTLLVTEDLTFNTPFGNQTASIEYVQDSYLTSNYGLYGHIGYFSKGSWDLSAGIGYNAVNVTSDIYPSAIQTINYPGLSDIFFRRYDHRKRLSVESKNQWIFLETFRNKMALNLSGEFSTTTATERIETVQNIEKDKLKLNRFTANRAFSLYKSDIDVGEYVQRSPPATQNIVSLGIGLSYFRKISNMTELYISPGYKLNMNSQADIYKGTFGSYHLKIGIRLNRFKLKEIK